MKKAILIIILTLAVTVLCGCSAAWSDDSSSEIDISESEEEYLDKLMEKNEESGQAIVKRVGVAMPTKTSERWINDGMNMKAKLETLGYEVDLQYADDDIDLQVSQIESMIKNDVNCLVISSIDSTKLTGALSSAKEKGIPVIAYDRLLMDTDAVSYYASFDNKAVGTLIGEYIVNKKNLEQAKKDGKSYTIEFFVGSPDDNNALYNYNGLMEVLNPYLKSGTLVCKSGLTSFEDTCILRWSEDTARERCLNLLDTYYTDEKLDIACSVFDGFAYGILNAFQNKGYSIDELPLISGQDAEKLAIKNINDNKQSMTIFKDTRILASKCVTMVQAVLEETEPAINDTEQYNNNVFTVPAYLCNPVVIDKDNYKEILIDGRYYTMEQLFK